MDEKAGDQDSGLSNPKGRETKGTDIGWCGTNEKVAKVAGRDKDGGEKEKGTG